MGLEVERAVGQTRPIETLSGDETGKTNARVSRPQGSTTYLHTLILSLDLSETFLSPERARDSPVLFFSLTAAHADDGTARTGYSINLNLTSRVKPAKLANTQAERRHREKVMKPKVDAS